MGTRIGRFGGYETGPMRTEASSGAGVGGFPVARAPSAMVAVNLALGGPRVEGLLAKAGGVPRARSLAPTPGPGLVGFAPWLSLGARRV